MTVGTPPTQATLAGFTAFVRDQMGVGVAVLPDDSGWLAFSYGIALEVVSLTLASVSAVMYVQAVYNLAGDNLLNFAQDAPNAPAVAAADNKDRLPYFAYLRQKWKLLDFVAGVVQSSGDETTNVSLVVQEAAKDFKLSDLQNLKTPYGRVYLQIVQRMGPVWGLS